MNVNTNKIRSLSLSVAQTFLQLGGLHHRTKARSDVCIEFDLLSQVKSRRSHECLWLPVRRLFEWG